MRWICVFSPLTFATFFVVSLSFIPSISIADKDGDAFVLLSDFGDKFLDEDEDDDYDEDFPGWWNLPSSDIKSSCYDENNHPQRCTPDFSNAASERNIYATNSCGLRSPRTFCRQMGTPWARAPCEICDATVPHRAHLPHHMTDFNTYRNLTWWMSDTMEDGIDYPGQVNLTLDFGKSFDISYVRLRFYSSRPESFAIYKRTYLDSEWEPYQYYSASCLETYGLPDGGQVSRTNETEALCTSEFSDISPLTGGTVVFSTLEGRPGAYDFENNQPLQEWVIATAIRITLDKMNTFGDEIFQDPVVLKSYYFAISDLSVGARCRCYGHASDCIRVPDEFTGILRLVCRCEHHTMGDDCDRCLPLFNQRPWASATPTQANECLPCNCNGKSNKCFFDQDLFDRTGSGGHCRDCEDNTEGVNCEKCKVLHYRRKEDRECIACDCNTIGSLGAQCSEDGQCPCKPGVGTRTCSKCAPNFYDMTPQGCRPCGCNLAGIAPDAPSCDPSLGYCPCKEHVVGQRCDSCKKGYFDLQLENEFGCVPCFCYGHSNECHSAPGFFKRLIETTFDENDENWTAVDLRGHEVPVFYDADLQIIEVRGKGGEFIYFIAPERYLGNQRASYNRYLTFTLRIGAENVRISAHDVILEGAGLRVSVPITEQGNPIPSHKIQMYKFRLHENPSFGWTPQLNAFDFMKILSNLTAIKIKATYSREGIGYLDDVILESADKVPNNSPATWIEQCVLPEGYTGLSCEFCATGYRRDPLGNSPYFRCVKCFCHNHADTCDPNTGKCVCKHNTQGHHCERCASSYYGDAREGTSADCKPCLCPDRGPCIMLPGGQVACQQCPLGHTGHQCDMCIDGYFGDPLGRFGPPRPCRKCECSGNIDPNAVGNCNTTSGQCLKCIYNSAGWNCERCLPGYYGSALTIPKGGCKRCTCYLPGTLEPERGTTPCETAGGECRCKANVVGRRCDKCRKGYWNIDSGEGCSACNCNRIGSANMTCDIRSGQCHCRPGVIGRHCDSCAPYHYGFSEEGCKACECDPAGSTSLQCDTAGQCQCRPNREGRRCSICRDIKYSKGTVCKDCPPCYSLLEEAIDRYKDKLSELARLMEEIKNHPETIEDLDFQRKLREAKRKIENLIDDAKRAAIADGGLINQLNDLRKRIKEIGETAGKVRERLDEGEEFRRYGSQNMSIAENAIQQAQDAATAARKYLDTQGRDAYNSALDRKDRLGQQSQKLSDIAREARQLADQQEEDAEVSDNVSNLALNTSTEAYKLARETLDSQEKMSNEVYYLGRKLDDLLDFVRRTKTLAEDAKKEANTAYDDALGIYTDANSLIVPTADVEAIKNEADRIKHEARRIKGQADDLANEHKDTLSHLDDKAKDAQGLLNEAVRQQQITDELLTDTDAALNKALDAIAFGEKILDDAKATHDTLKGFDKQVKDSAERAAETLKKIPPVKANVGKAENKTFDAEDALRGAIQDAADARDIAREAKKLAEQASKDADEIRKDASETKADAGKLKNQAGQLIGQIKRTDERMVGFEDEAENDGVSSKEILSSANEAKNAALDAIDKGRSAAAKLDDILEALDDIDSVDNYQLDELERLLALAERELLNADLGRRAEILREAQEEQKKWMRDYEDEIDQLKKDVANIDAIRASLPEDCYRRLVLEP